MQAADRFEEAQVMAGQVRVREVGRIRAVCHQLSHSSCVVRGLVGTFVLLSSIRLWCEWLGNQFGPYCWNTQLPQNLGIFQAVVAISKLSSVRPLCRAHDKAIYMLQLFLCSGMASVDYSQCWAIADLLLHSCCTSTNTLSRSKPRDAALPCTNVLAAAHFIDWGTGLG